MPRGLFVGRRRDAAEGSVELARLLVGARPERVEEVVQALNVEPWMELPLWLPEGFAWQVGTDRAQVAGLRCRPIADTVADIAAWLRAGGEQELDDWRSEHRPTPMSAEREAELLNAVP